MDRVVAIVQARMGSTRLPGKVLAPLAGKPMLVRVIDRVRRTRLIHDTVVATSTSDADDSIASLCAANDISCFRGSENDVLDRYYQAARTHAAEVVVRVTADCPLIDPGVLDRLIAIFFEGGYDYVTNALRPTYPHGLEAEVFSFAALERCARESELPSEREHVTGYMLSSGKFRLLNVENDADLSSERHRWTVDRPEDLAYVQAIFDELDGGDPFGMNDVLALLARKPQLRKLEGHEVPMAGYYKSIYDEVTALDDDAEGTVVNVDGAWEVDLRGTQPTQAVGAKAELVADQIAAAITIFTQLAGIENRMRCRRQGNMVKVEMDDRRERFVETLRSQGVLCNDALVIPSTLAQSQIERLLRALAIATKTIALEAR